MKVGIIGSGGREHAICHNIKKSKKIKKIFCFPGNAGTSTLAENINIDLEYFEKIKDFLFLNQIELVIIGPEKPLVEGLVDYLEKYNIKVFGPDKISSQRGSIFTKNYVKNLIFQLQNLEYFTTKIKQKNFRKNKLSNCN